MKINIKNVLRINNSIENTIYYQGIPNKVLINHNNLPQMFEIIINNLVLTRSFLYYINSLFNKNQNDFVWINISLIRGILGREDLRLDLPPISMSVLNLKLLRDFKLCSDLLSAYNNFYFEQIHKQMEDKIKFNVLQNEILHLLFNNSDNNTSSLLLNKVFIKLSNKNEGFNSKEQLKIFKKYK
jgi:hypothetical protein